MDTKTLIKAMEERGMDTSTLQALESPKNYWQDDNGRMSCEDVRCAGRYLHMCIQAKPKAKKHSTPLGTYTKLTQAEIADVRSWSDDGDQGVCESCEWHKTTK